MNLFKSNKVNFTIKILVLTVFIVIPFGFSHSVHAATYYVDSTNGNNPTVNGNLTDTVKWTTNGKYGDALIFDGGKNSYVNLGSTSILKPSKFTFSTWIYSNSTTTKQAIFKPSYSNGYNSGFLLYVSQNGSIGFRYGDGSSSVGSISTSGVDYRGVWHFVTISFDGTNASIYIDGVLKKTGNASTLNYSTVNFYSQIGGSSGVNSFDGTIDDVRFYNRVLSTKEITGLYNNINIPTKGIIFYLPFDIGSGISVGDVSKGNGLSISSPWKTILQVNNFIFQPGDSILFKKGDIWRNFLNISSSGTQAKPIVFSSYGSGSSPVIDGSTQVTGWSVYSGNIYVAKVSFPVSNVFVDNIFYDTARYPSDTYEKITSNSTNKTSLISSGFTPPSSDLVGAKIHIRDVQWRIESKTISSYSASNKTLGWNSDTNYPILSDFGFYLTNKLWMLSKPGQWYYDSLSGKLYLWVSDGSNPNFHSVTATTNSSIGIKSSNKNYFTIKDIDIKNTGSYGVQLYDSKGVIIQNLNISNAGRYGIYAYGPTSDNITISNNNIDKALISGIDFSNIPSTSITVSGNTISNTGNFGNPSTTYAGVNITKSNNIRVVNNIISNSGYDGIMFSGSNNLIKNNTITNSCLVLNDCGAIYTWGDFGSGNNVIDNVILNTSDNINGVPNQSRANGIYLDDHTHGTTVSGNTIFNTDNGINIHNSYNNNILANTVFAPLFNDLRINDGKQVTHNIIKNNIIKNNVFVTTSASQASLYFNFFTYGDANFGTSNNNYISSNYDTTPITQRIFKDITNYTLHEWQIASSQDLNTKDINDFFTVVNSKITSFLDKNFVTNSTFDSSLSKWSVWSSNGKAAINWVATCGIDSGCLHVVTSSPSSIASSNSFLLKAGVTYQVSFSIISSSKYKVTAMLRKAGPPWTVYGRKEVNTNSNRQNISFIFVAPKSISSRLDFNSTSADYYIDNVSVRPVTVINNNPSNGIAFYYATSAPKSINLGSTKYVDIHNNKVSGVLNLSAYTSKVLFKAFGNNDLTCNNRETFATAPTECLTPEDEGHSAVLDAPYTIGTDNIPTTGSIRIYGNGKYRMITPKSNTSTASFAVTPKGGSYSATTTQFMDITINKWEKTGDKNKEWTATSTNRLLKTQDVTYTVGDLLPNTNYQLNVDGASPTITGTDCKTNGFCISNSSGEIAFSYISGHSVDTFALHKDAVQTIAIKNTNQIQQSTIGGGGGSIYIPTPVQHVLMANDSISQSTHISSTINLDKNKLGVVNIISNNTDVIQIKPVALKNITASYIFIKPIYKAVRNEEVVKLQQVLRKLGLFNYLRNTGYYGTITERAVKRFQCEYKIICYGTPWTTGYGVVGPKTRKVLNAISLKNSVASATTQTKQQKLDYLEKEVSAIFDMVKKLQKELDIIVRNH